MFALDLVRKHSFPLGQNGPRRRLRDFSGRIGGCDRPHYERLVTIDCRDESFANLADCMRINVRSDNSPLRLK